jgi:hypothetical protein
VNLRSDIIDRDELTIAAVRARKRGADIHVHEISQTKGRGKRFSVTFYAYSFNGKRATNRGDGEKAASWSDYGWLIAELFVIDPEAIVGSYKGVADFVRSCEAMHTGRAQYTADNPRSGPNPYAPIDFLDIVRPLVSS